MPNQQTADELAQLRASLEAVKKEYGNFQAQIAETANYQKQQYLEVIMRLINLREQRQGIFLETQADLDKQAIKEIVGARLENVSGEALHVCDVAVKHFIEAPSQAAVVSLNSNCANYSRRIRALVDCLAQVPPAAGSSLLFGGTTGVRVATDVVRRSASAHRTKSNDARP